MEKLYQLHLEAVESVEYEEIKNSAIYKIDFQEAATKSAEITKDIAIRFARYIEKYNSTIKIQNVPVEKLFHEFLKTIK